MPSGGEIRLEARAADGGVEIRVIDRGSGIPEEERAHIFELFYSTKERGTGLGLAVAKKIVDEHDGAISVRSTPGEGTTFSIRLPVYNQNIADPSQTIGPAR